MSSYYFFITWIINSENILFGNFIFVDIKVFFGYVIYVFLRFFVVEGVEVVDIWGFIRDFKIADVVVIL